jgi:hypothetical protein
LTLTSQTYAYLHFDDFSWGETRKINGPDAGHGAEEASNANDEVEAILKIPLKVKTRTHLIFVFFFFFFVLRVFSDFGVILVPCSSTTSTWRRKWADCLLAWRRPQRLLSPTRGLVQRRLSWGYHRWETTFETIVEDEYLYTKLQKLQSKSELALDNDFVLGILHRGAFSQRSYSLLLLQLGQMKTDPSRRRSHHRRRIAFVDDLTTKKKKKGENS